MNLDHPRVTTERQSAVERVLSRPPGERIREFRYRFAQSLVFGLPVFALQWLGPRLGGQEAVRWTGLLQALLAGWVLYVAAAGMVSEGMLLLARGRLGIDLIVSLAAAILYIVSVVAWVVLLTPRRAAGAPALLLFHYSVLVLIVWCGVRWAWLSRPAIRLTATEADPTSCIPDR